MPRLSEGAVFSGYRIEGVAGEGGMALVYRARHLGLERQVALKVMGAGVAHDPDFRERFVRESRMAASIDHPNVIPIYEAGEEDGQLFIAMRYVEGTDLGALIKRDGALEPQRAVRVVERVGAALDAAHRRGLVHRDVKPANVLIAEDGEDHVYLSDFGLTKKSSAPTGLTRTGQFMGTLDYVAPEQIRGEAVDARSDVYALGCVLFHALCGRPAFVKDSEVATLWAHLEEPPPSVTASGTAAAPGLDPVVQRAMAKDPAERYDSAGDLGRAALAALDDAAPPVPAPRAAGAAPPTRARRAAPRGWPQSPGGRVPLRAALATLGAVALAVVALAILGVFGGEDEKPPAAPAPAAAPVARAPAVVASIEAGDGPEGIAVDGRNVWVVDSRDNRLRRIDARSDRVVGDPLLVGRDPDGVTAAKGVLWVTNTADDTLRRVEARPDPIPGASIDVGASPEGVSLGKQLVWVANGGDDTVSRIDRASPTVLGSPIGVGRRPIGVFVGQDSVWVTNNADGTVTRVDSSTSEVVGGPIPVGREPRGVAEADGRVWVANSGDDTVSRLDAGSGRVVGEPVRVGDNPRELAVGGGFVWVANNDSNDVTRLDAATGRVIGQAIPVGRDPLGVAFGAGAVWVANNGDGTVTRIRP